MKISIRFSILQTFVILVLLTVSGIALTFYFGSNRIMVNLYSQITNLAAQRIVERTINFLEVPGTATRLISQLFQESDIVADHETIWQQLWEQVVLLPHISSIYIADRQGNFVQVRRYPRLATRIVNRSTSPPVDRWVYRDENYRRIGTEIRPLDYDPRQRPWFVGTEGTERITWSDVYLFHATGEPGITGSFPILDNNGKIRAVVGVDISLYKLSEFVNAQPLHQTTVIVIVNDQDEAITHWQPDTWQPVEGRTPALPKVQDLKNPWLTDAYRQHLATGRQLLQTRTGGESYAGVFVDFPDSFQKRWKIAAVAPKEVLTGPTDTIIARAILVAIVITGICLVFIYFFSGLITRPVERLADESKLIRDMRLEKVKGVESILIEIRSLNNSFMAMKNGLASFRRYVPDQLVRQLIAAGRQARRGGEKERLAILFTDIVGFTSLSESISIEELFEQLSEYLDRLTGIILEEKGTLDKYIGDAIMSFWGAPLQVDDVSGHACRAALRVREEVEKLNRQWAEAGKPPMPTCIGIHTGNTLVGNVGSRDRMSYSIYGDNVNLASRLEGVNRIYGTQVIISHDTYLDVAERFVCRPLDVVKVKGKKKSIRIYELVAESEANLSEDQVRFYRQFSQACEAYLKKDWQIALEMFEILTTDFPDDTPTAIYVNRCREILENPDAIPENWDGTTKLDKK